MFIKKLLLLLFCFTIFTSTSYAVTLEAFYNATGSGAPFSDSQTVSSGTAAVSGLSYATYPGGSSSAGSLIDDTGRMALRAIGMGASFYADATTIYSESFTNATGAAKNYSVDFLVNEGVVQFYNGFDLPTVNWASSLYDIEILAGTDVLWASTGKVERLQSGSASFTETGSSLGGAFALGANASYTWSDYNDTVSFLLNPGESKVFSYHMTVEVEGNITCPVNTPPMVNNPFGPTYPCPIDHTSRIGDPFDFASNAAAIGDVTVTNAVPLPAAAWLFASGLLGLLGFARRNIER